MAEKPDFLVIGQPVQGIGEVYHVRPAGCKLPQTVQFHLGQPPSWPVAESPCTDEIAACHAALSGGTLDLGKLLFRDFGDHHLVTPYKGPLLSGFLFGSIFFVCHN